MSSEQIHEGKWNEIQGKIRQRWGQLTEDDISQAHGRIDQLVGTIQRKTGEGREAIENYLNQLSGSGAATARQAADTVRSYAQGAAQYAQQAAQGAQDAGKQATDQMMAGYRQAEEFVQQRPGESLALCFGVGLVVGVVLAMMISSR